MNASLDRAYRVEEAGGVARHRVVVFGTTDGGCRYPAAADSAGVLGVTQHAQTRQDKAVTVRRTGIALCEAAAAIGKGDAVVVADDEGRIKSAARASLAFGLVGSNNALVLTCRVPGLVGNALSVELLAEENNQTLALAVVGTTISIELATNGSGDSTTTGAQLLALINGHATASNMVVAAHATGSTGAGIVAALAQAPLTGGEGGINVVGFAQERATASGDVVEVMVAP